MAREANPELVRRVDEGRIILAGQPNALRGAVYLENSSAERVRLRRLPLSLGEEGAARTLAAARPEAGPPPAVQPRVRLSPGIIRPGHAGPVSLSLALDPHTPPGEYQAEVEIAGQLQPVTLIVTERVDLRISPAVVVVENRPDETIFKQIVVSNLGNVPLRIGKIGAIFLDDELLVCRTLRHAAASVGDDLRPFEEYLARILLSAKQVAERSGILRVYSRTGEVLIQPGEVRPIDLEIRVPATLDRRGRYRGVSALYTASLTFLVVPTAGPSLPDAGPGPIRLAAEEETPPEEPPAPRRRRRRSSTPPEGSPPASSEESEENP
jgi:hypothetical protein